MLTESYDKAIADFGKTLEFISNDAGIYLDRGVAYAKTGKYELANRDYGKAIGLYSQQIEKYPNDAYAFFNRGTTYSDISEFMRAIDDFSAYIRLVPNDMSGYLRRSKAYEFVGKDDPAKADRKKFVELGGTLERSSSNSFREIYPPITFDAQAAKSALAVGDSVIRGRACTIKDGLIFTAANVRISLYPVTSYVEAWEKLRDQKEDKNTAVYMSPEAVKHRIDVVTDSEGRFQFKEMKPGKYFLQGVFSFYQAKSRDVYTGTETYGDGSATDYYRREEYAVPRSDRLEKTIEIKKDSETVKITMSKGPPLRFLKFGGACSVW